MASIETNLNQSPFFDDFNEEKNFHRILFRPGYAVQARELTQLQTILQNQVERFGDEILKNGTIINGCDLEVQKWDFVKLKDRNPVTTNPLLLNQFFNGTATANITITGVTSGVTARLLYAVEGSESAAPNNLTAFVSYTNSGTDKLTKTFANGEQLTFTNNSDSSLSFVAEAIASSATGLGMGASVSEGVVYHKGHFIRSHEQVGVVSKYSTTSTVKVGLETLESIVDSNQDSSLLDNATGSTNLTAPGASRLKIQTKVASRGPSSVDTSDFFVIADIQDGRVIRSYDSTSYGDLEDELARRTFEESGNYSLEPFVVSVQEHNRTLVNGGVYGSTGSDEVGNSSKLVVEVEPSVGYVKGYRTELVNTSRTTIDKATDTLSRNAIVVGQNIGNYVICQNVLGAFSPKTLDAVSIRSTAHGKSSTDNTTPGSEVGTARVRGFEYHSAGKYKIYLYDIQMNTGKSFLNHAKSLLVVNGLASSENSFADIVLESSKAKLKDTNLLNLVYPLQSSGMKSLSSQQYIYREEQDIQFDSSGDVQFNLATAPAGGTHSLNDTGQTLSTSDKNNIIIVFKDADASSSTDQGQVHTWVDSDVVSAQTGQMTINLNKTFGSAVNATVFYNVLRASSSPSSKSVQRSQYVHLDIANNSAGVNGPWELGVADGLELEAVYESTSGSISTAGTDVTKHFNFDTGQRDAFYDGARISKNANSTYDVTGKHLLVKFSYFSTSRSSGRGYYNIDSYITGDPETNDAAAVSDTSKIFTQEIPKFVRSDGTVVDLRDSVDFRPIKTNTATTVSGGTAPTNPSALTAYNITNNASFFPTPDENYQTNITKFLPRIDLVTLKSSSEVRVLKGASNDSPIAPAKDEDSMVLAGIFIPPYPSLAPAAALHYGRPSYEVVVARKDNRRLTMEDVRKVANEVEIHREWIYLNHKEVRALNKSVLLAEDPIDVAEPPKNSLVIDPPPEPVVENTLRTSPLPYSKDPLRVIPKLEDIEFKLQSGSTGLDTTTDIITVASTGYSTLVNQQYATKRRSVTVSSNVPAKLYNGQMHVTHRVCTLEQIVDTVVDPSPVPEITPNPPPISYVSFGHGYGVGFMGASHVMNLGLHGFGF